MRTELRLKNLEDLGVDRLKLLKGIEERRVRGVNWIYPAQDTGRWRILVSTVMILLLS